MTDEIDDEQAAKTALADQVRNVHRRYPTGVTVVTVAVDGVPYGLAVNAFSSVSLEPPLILVVVNATSQTFRWLFSAEYIGVNILSTDQNDVVKGFARSGGDKFAGVAWHPGVTGAPVLDNSTGHFELRVTHKIPAFTHTIFIGEVVEAGYSDIPPLSYLGGQFYDSSKLTAE